MFYEKKKKKLILNNNKVYFSALYDAIKFIQQW